MAACHGSRGHEPARDAQVEADAARDAGHGNDAGSARDAGDDAGNSLCPQAPSASGADPSHAPEADPQLAAESHAFFTLKVEDADGNPIRGAQLTTVTKVVLTSDDQGIVAFYEPGFMNQRVFFHVQHIGYQHSADGFGFRGEAVDVSEGGSAIIKLEKTSGDLPAQQGDLQSRLVAGKVPGAADCFALRVLDPSNKRGVPLVRISAFNEEWWSDSQGMIAFCHPDHLDQEVTFDVFSHGYGLPDGSTSPKFITQRGTNDTLELKRKLAAERLYRITGTGVYRDSILLGLTTPIEKPVINALVGGSDTASTTLYRGKLFWMWQDTDRIAYPLGNFRGTGALSELESSGGLSPHLGANLAYFTGDDGFAKPMSEDFEPAGSPVWMAGLVSVPDAAGEERLFAGYAKVRGLGDIAEAGVMRFDDTSTEFKRVVTNLLEDGFVRPDGHAFKFRHGAQTFVYYPDRLRIPASAEAMVDRNLYEQFSPFAAGGAGELVMGKDGKLDYAFRAGAKHATSQALATLNVPHEQDLDGHDVNIDSGEDLTVLAPSVVWNAYRKRFLRISQASGNMGNLFHAEADTPMGPWVYAQKVIEHDQYTFYNPFHHPEFDQRGGRTIFLEGTYTTTFTVPEPVATPRYNYNQVMYRLALDAPELKAPVAFYQSAGELVSKRELRPGKDKLTATFFAHDHALDGALPVAWSGAACEARVLEASDTPKTKPIFYAIPGTSSAPSAHHVALYEYRHPDGRRAYDLAGAALAGFTRADQPLVWVWANPVQVALPVRDYLDSLIADAGADQCVSSGASITLDGSRSGARDSPIVRYLWSVPGARPCELVEGEKVSLQLPKGLHSIDLTVLDGTGNSSSDTLIVSVQ